MDVITLLRRDHATVSSLFALIQRGFAEPDTPERPSFRLNNIEGTGTGLEGVYSVSHITAGLSLHW